MKTVLNIEECRTRWALCILLFSPQAGRGGKGWAGADLWPSRPLPFATKDAKPLPAYKMLANTAFAGVHPVQFRAHATIGVGGG